MLALSITPRRRWPRGAESGMHFDGLGRPHEGEQRDKACPPSTLIEYQRPQRQLPAPLTTAGAPALWLSWARSLLSVVVYTVAAHAFSEVFLSLHHPSYWRLPSTCLKRDITRHPTVADLRGAFREAFAKGCSTPAPTGRTRLRGSATLGPPPRTQNCALSTSSHLLSCQCPSRPRIPSETPPGLPQLFRSPTTVDRSQSGSDGVMRVDPAIPSPSLHHAMGADEIPVHFDSASPSERSILVSSASPTSAAPEQQRVLPGALDPRAWGNLSLASWSTPGSSPPPATRIDIKAKPAEEGSPVSERGQRLQASPAAHLCAYHLEHRVRGAARRPSLPGVEGPPSLIPRESSRSVLVMR